MFSKQSSLQFFCLFNNWVNNHVRDAIRGIKSTLEVLEVLNSWK